MKIRHIALVGHGAVGAVVIQQFIEQMLSEDMHRMLSLTVCEKSSTSAIGLAYGTLNPEHINNMQPHVMSANPDHPMECFDWCLDSGLIDGSDYKAGTYISRKNYGRYLRRRFHDKPALRAAQAGIPLRFVRKEVVSVRSSGDGFVCELSDGTEFYADYVFLTTGNHPPTNYPHLRGRPGYIPHCWPEHELVDNVPKDEPVVMLGTGLTFIDGAITLKCGGHRGPVTAMSHHGFLPHVRPDYDWRYRPRFFTEPWLRYLAASGNGSFSIRDLCLLLQMEAHEAGTSAADFLNLASFDDYDVETVINEQVRQANTHSPAFTALKAAESAIPFLWPRIPLPEREAFLAKWGAAWNAVVYPCPLPNGEKLQRWLKSGWLTVEGGLLDVKYDIARRRFEFALEGGRRLNSRWVINATGQSYDIENLQSPLIRDLVRRGMMSKHRLGGARVEPATGRLIDDRDRVNPKLYLVGSLAKGELFFTNSISENAKCAKRAVRAALNHIREQRISGPLKSLSREAGRWAAE